MGGPYNKTVIFWGLYWGPLILGNYHILADCKATLQKHLARVGRKVVKPGRKGGLSKYILGTLQGDIKGDTSIV